MSEYNIKKIADVACDSFDVENIKVFDVPQHCYAIINCKDNPGFFLKTANVGPCTAFYAVNKEKGIICLAHFDGHTSGAKKMVAALKEEAGGTLDGFEFGAISGVSVSTRFIWSVLLSIFAGYLSFLLLSIFFPWLPFAVFFLISFGVLIGLMTPIIGIMYLTRKKYMKTPALSLKPLGLILGFDGGKLLKDDDKDSKERYENKGCFLCPIRRIFLVN